MIKIVFLAVVMSALAACGGGGSSTPTDSSDTGTDSGITVKTTVDLGGASGVADTRMAGRAAAIAVTLTMADGTTYTMEDNGNGEYSCVVRNYTDGTVGYVEAHAGDLVLKNFFDSLDDQSGEASIGATDPDTTLFVDVLQTYVAALTNNGNTVSAAQLMQGFTDATLQIDVNTFKASVQNDGEYEQLRETYTANLSWSNYENNVAVDMESVVHESVAELVQTGGVIVPENSMTSDSMKELVQSFIEAYGSGDLTTLASATDADSFLDNGYNLEAWINDAQQMINELTDNNLTFVMNDIDSKVMKVSDTAYKVWPDTHEQAKDAAGNVITEEHYNSALNFVDKMLPMYIEKIGDKWALTGNHQKSEVWMSAGFYKSEDSGIQHRFWAEVEETDLYPVSAATVTSDIFDSEAALLRAPENDSNQLQVFLDDNGACGSFSVPCSTRWVKDFCANRDVELKVTYSDTTEAVYNFTLPACPSDAYITEYMPAIGDITTAEDGRVTVPYTIAAEDGIADIQFEIYDGSNVVYDSEDTPFALRAITIGNDVFESGKTYYVSLEVEDLYGRRFATSRQFTY